MPAWSKDELRKIVESDDLHISPPRQDGVTYGTPTWIWSVAVDNALYVRAYNGQNSRWYQAAVRQKAGRITAAGMTKEVMFEPVQGSINDRVDDAYRAKYRSSEYLNSMIGTRARAATIKIIPRGRFMSVRRVLSLLICLTIPYLEARADEIRGLVTIGMQRVFEEVRPAFERASARTLNVQFASSPDIAKLVEEGEAADFIIISRTAADGLITSGIVPANNQFVLGGSSIAVAVPAGRPKPDVSSPERLRSALLAAKAIAYTDPASGGPSGIQFAKVLERLGIAEQVRPKTKFPPAGGLVGELLASGEADIGIQQSTELSSFRGVDVVGLLPSEFQIVTEYAAAIPANAVNPEGAKALVEFMRSTGGAAAMKAKGLDPQ
jgi:molybdate transport system substrate-binding protein